MQERGKQKRRNEKKKEKHWKEKILGSVQDKGGYGDTILVTLATAA